MIGHPKYNINDVVTFKDIDGKSYSGIIKVVDINGTFEDNSDVSYDILASGFDCYKTKENPNGECFVKHIREDFVYDI